MSISNHTFLVFPITTRGKRIKSVVQSIPMKKETILVPYEVKHVFLPIVIFIRCSSMIDSQVLYVLSSELLSAHSKTVIVPLEVAHFIYWTRDTFISSKQCSELLHDNCGGCFMLQAIKLSMTFAPYFDYFCWISEPSSWYTPI